MTKLTSAEKKPAARKLHQRFVSVSAAGRLPACVGADGFCPEPPRQWNGAFLKNAGRSDVRARLPENGLNHINAARVAIAPILELSARASTFDSERLEISASIFP
jgi:hypothetical protein